MDLVRDLLDEKVVDRHGREMGRVDDITLEIRDAAPPRVSAIELGPVVVARRLHPTLGRWVAALEHALGIAEGRPLRIPIADFTIRDAVRADRAFGETAARRWSGGSARSSARLRDHHERKHRGRPRRAPA